MNRRYRLLPQLVRCLKLSKKEVLGLIMQTGVYVDGKLVSSNEYVDKDSELRIGNQLIRPRKKSLYFLLNKPRGVECTLNAAIKDNLIPYLPSSAIKLFPVGRLDKDSEGLLLLTSDGYLYNTFTRINTTIEKEYLVWVDKIIDTEFKIQMENGVLISGKLTLPCKLELKGERYFSIILTEGRNRQIRRMCYKLGYEVIRLQRIRIDKYTLEGIKIGECLQVHSPI